MKPEPTTHRRFLLTGVLPFSLLMIAVPLAPQVIPQIQDTFRVLNSRQMAMVSPASPITAELRYDKDTPRISPSIMPGLRKGRRMIALDVIRRLEEQARRQGGEASLTPLDLRRLRNAFREAESEAISPTQ